jgi:ApaG protein
MEGTFYCMTEDAHPFDTPIPVFVLAQPGALH